MYFDSECPSHAARADLPFLAGPPQMHVTPDFLTGYRVQLSLWPL